MAAFVVRTGVPRNYIAISCIVSEIKRVENRDFYTHLQLTPPVKGSPRNFADTFPTDNN